MCTGGVNLYVFFLLSICRSKKKLNKMSSCGFSVTSVSKVVSSSLIKGSRKVRATTAVILEVVYSRNNAKKIDKSSTSVILTIYIW